jgi:hypothetical protein
MLDNDVDAGHYAFQQQGEKRRDHDAVWVPSRKNSQHGLVSFFDHRSSSIAHPLL